MSEDEKKQRKGEMPSNNDMDEENISIGIDETMTVEEWDESNDDDFTDEEVSVFIDETVNSKKENVNVAEPDMRFGDDEEAHRINKNKKLIDDGKKKEFKDIYKRGRKEPLREKVKRTKGKFLIKKKIKASGNSILRSLDFILNSVVIASTVAGIYYSIKYINSGNWIMTLCCCAFIIVTVYVNDKITNER